ncbi:fructose-specific PTS transporter subunit EIIC [Staphylococcus agnetis]|uniref:fructose-specific PTS transporter subunit EIIC n=1 Tax=Staphylococcus agnetis TaxID=985762 RepID=UPI00208FBB85|nr:fructose-specific PTS transporter subunit EIIC [Staphylococcus agnetis]MCO4340174.1 fructose-specific PTS transporter subunit EIIC [Staphylococcus agnetis]MCO4343971.1 fructose-specific PTS transporter subunit EIIC [Staphylococcus agnetis]MCO4345553.1 fructose-specific PTS transporter subunit EIIC [Staphylococcus agnetis]MCO4347139.1 fructose-specific PTS transporter subunit EIIC [Staphylococcus agnetis]MCO4349577.1 fructose-specific PTS transporter subunit EIIC [Staphylococcus agnetis]
MKIVAVTSCPNGIAHTYMAQEKLEQAAHELGIDIKVETQGGVGVENQLTAKDIEEADGVIIAADRQVDLSRFHGKLLINENVRAGIHHPKDLIERIQQKKASVYHSETQDENAKLSSDEKQKHKGIQHVYQHLMNGVSFMVPFIVVGGLLIAIALSLGGEKTATQGIVIPDDSFWKPFEKIGALAFSFMVPILAGYIAMSIADKPGLVPGMIGGAIAADGSFYGSDAGAGFLGGIVAGFLAGYIAKWIKQVKVPKAMAPIMPIIIIPIISSIIVGLIFIYVIGAPIAGIFAGLTAWLKGMQGANIVILAMIIGAMIAFDMGGPVNKVAFLFGSALIAEGNYSVMGMVAVAVCTPPIGLGIATFMNRRKFNNNEIEMGKASFTMGLFGITEGAIPFAAQDPLRIIPANIIGAMVAAVIAALGGVGDRVAHGGPIVAVLGGIDKVVIFFIAVIIGSLVTAALVLVLKKRSPIVATAGGHETSIETTENIGHADATTNKDASQTQLIHKNTTMINTQPMTRDEAIEHMVSNLDKQGYVKDKATLTRDIFAREAESTTALGMNIAMPHAKSAGIKEPVVSVLKNNEGVTWESLDGTVPQIVFLITVPEHSHDTHLKTLQNLSRDLMDDAKREALLQSETENVLYQHMLEIMK